jgi:hypothetical protein
MGLSKAKSLLPVRDGLTFLDLIARQVLAARAHLRRAAAAAVPALVQHAGRLPRRAGRLPASSWSTGFPLDMVQSQEPKLRADDLTPVSWPADPNLEWCPPGHGDIYPTLLDSGVLDGLLAAGFRYANVSNSDNLGASPSPELAGWFARSGAPFAAEITPRTAMDVKGGHLARRRSDGQLILRESAQTTAEDMQYFTDPDIHPYASTNNLWFDLQVLRDVLRERGRRAGAADHPQRQDRRPQGPVQPGGRTDRVRHGRGDRGLRGRDRHRRTAQPLPARQDHERAGAAAQRRVRVGRRRHPARDRRHVAGREPRPARTRRSATSRPACRHRWSFARRPP